MNTGLNKVEGDLAVMTDDDMDYDISRFRLGRLMVAKCIRLVASLRPGGKKFLNNKYIIYKSSGGLTHYLKGLAYSFEVAKKYHRILLIDNNSPGVKGIKFNDFFEFKENIIYHDNDYSKIPQTYLYKNKYDLKQVKESIYRYEKDCKYIVLDQNVNIDLLEKNDPDDIIIYCGPRGNVHSISKYIQLKNSVIKKIKDKFIGSKLYNEKYISAHFRNTDRKNDIKFYIDKLKELTNKEKIETVFVATDDVESIDNFKNALPGVNIIYNETIPKSINKKNIHSNPEDPFRQVFNVLLDIYYILNAAYFIPSNNSYLSLFIKDMIITKANIFNLTNTKIDVIT